MNKAVEKVSVHGGHSGAFCNHATGTLEEIVQAYIEAGYSWVGITEHMPPAEEAFLYPEEKEAGMTPDKMRRRFFGYIRECRRLQHKYSKELTLFVGMETETYRGYQELVTGLLAEFQPDYIVGSLHHVDDIPFDYSHREYERAAEHAGGLDALYCRYFDQQYEMIEYLKPAVVGHFDLIRMFDDDYKARLEKVEIVERIDRNLESIARNGLILDFNLRSLLKGAEEPYVSRSILARALARNISVVPGDDSHGPDSIDSDMNKGIEVLLQAGFTGKWQRPNLY